MRIAIPVLHDRISPVLDTAARVLLVRRQRGKEVERKELVLSPLPTDKLARNLAELHVEVLLCAALSEALSRALRRQHVRVRSHLCGEVESVLRALAQNQLDREEFRMPGCLGLHLHEACKRKRRPTRPGNRAAWKESK